MAGFETFTFSAKSQIQRRLFEWEPFGMTVA